MKVVKLLLPLLIAVSLGFILSGCPKSGKMMNNDTPLQSTIERIG